MKKISELDAEEVPSYVDVRNRLNQVIRAVNGLKCVDEEMPVLETLADDECFLISMSEEGLLVACNKDGEVRLEKVKEKTEIREIEVRAGDNVGDVIKKAWEVHMKDYMPIRFRFSGSTITIIYDGTEHLAGYKGEG